MYYNGRYNFITRDDDDLSLSRFSSLVILRAFSLQLGNYRRLAHCFNCQRPARVAFLGPSFRAELSRADDDEARLKRFSRGARSRLGARQ
jgi:hypothetical protein